MIRRGIVLLLLWASSSFAYLITETNFVEQNRVLKSLDIDASFLKDPTFLSMKDDVDRYRTKNFLAVLERGYEFVPILRQMIKQADIPDAFLYMAMAESNFSARAYSKAKASGLWQFMPYTAKKFGLTIDMYVDERRDPIKSTEAAIQYLKYLYSHFGKWYLAAMAYNCGEGRVLKAIKEAKTDDLSILLNPRKKYLPRETREYIRKILTMAHMSGSADFIIGNDADYLMNQGSSLTLSRIEVPGGTTLSDVAESVGLPLKVIQEYNSHLNYFFTPPWVESYHLYLPYDKQIAFKQNFKPDETNGKFYVHVVERGDSLHKISKKYGVNYKIIKDFNRLKSNFLSLRQRLIVPVLKPKIDHYVIQKGDTLGDISARYKVSLSDLMQANKMKNEMIQPGVKLVIPQKY